MKKPTGSGLKKKSTVVIKFIEELVKIGNAFSVTDVIVVLR